MNLEDITNELRAKYEAAKVKYNLRSYGGNDDAAEGEINYPLERGGIEGQPEGSAEVLLSEDQINEILRRL